MKEILKTAGALVLILCLATAGAMAAVQFDNETADTSTKSDVHSSSKAVAWNESADIYLEAQVEGTVPAFELLDPEEGNESLVWLNGTDVNQEHSDTSTNPNTYYYSANVSQSAVLGDVEMNAGENKTIYFRVVNDSRTPSTATNSTLNVTIMNDNNRTFLILEDSEVGSNGVAEVPSESSLGISLPLVHSDVATIDQSVSINGSGTEATIRLDNSTVADRFSESAEDKESEEWIESTILSVDGDAKKVYFDSAPSDADGTYGVYDSGADEITIHYGDEYDGESSSDVVIDANRGFTDQGQAYGFLEVLGL